MLVVIYLFNNYLSKSTFFVINMAFDPLLNAILSNKLEFFVSCNNIKLARTSFFCSDVLISTFL